MKEKVLKIPLENLRRIGNRYKDEKARRFALKTYIKFLIIGVDNLWKEMKEKIR